MPTGKSRLDGSADQHPQDLTQVHTLFEMYVDGFSLVNDLAKLERVIHQQEEDLEPGTGITAADALMRVAAAYTAKHRTTGSLEDQQAAAMLLLESSNAIPDDHPNKPLWIHLASGAFFTIFERTQDIDDLEVVIQQLQAVLDLSNGNAELHASTLHQLGVVHQAEFAVTSDLAALDTAIGNFQSSLEAISQSHPIRAQGLVLLAGAESSKYFRTGDVEALKSSIKHSELALDMLPRDDSERVSQNGILGTLYLELYSKLKDVALLNKSVDVYDELLHDVSMDDPTRGITLYQQGRAHEELSAATESMAHLEVAVRQFKAAVDIIPARDPDRVKMLSHAAEKSYELYRQTRGLENLENSFILLQDRLQLLPDDFAHRRETLLALADLAFNKCHHTIKLEDIGAAMRMFKKLLDDMPEDDPERLSCETRHSQLSSVEKVLFGHDHPKLQSQDPSTYEAKLLKKVLGWRQVEDVATWEEWIRESEDALKNAPSDYAHRVMEKIQLGISYHHLWEKKGLMEHLDQSIKNLQEEHVGVTEHSPVRITRLIYLSTALLNKHDKTNTQSDWNAAIQAFQGLLDTGAYPPLSLLQHFHNTLRSTYNETYDEEYLDLFLKIHQKVLKLAPSNGVKRSLPLHGIGWVHLRRYDTRRAISDLETAIRYFDEAIKASPKDYDGLEEYLCDSGLAYRARHTRTSGLGDLDTTVERLQEAVRISKDGATHHSRNLMHLGRAYQRRFIVKEQKIDLERCAECMRNIKLWDGETERDKLTILATIMWMYWVEYGITKDISTWEQFLQDYCEEALDALPESNPMRVSHLSLVGTAYIRHYGETRNDMSLVKSIMHLQEAIASPHCPPRTKVSVCGSLLWLYTLLEDWSEAFDIATTLFSQLPLFISHALENVDKQHLLTTLVGLASNAAAVALSADKSPYEALRLLEAGRGVIMGSLLGLRSDVEELEKNHPEIAKEYLRLRGLVDSVKGDISNPAAAWLPIHQPDYRYNSAKDLERIIDNIRDLPGFSSFLKEPSEERMREATVLGPVVVINVCTLRCDAIIIESPGIRSLRLSDVTMEDVRVRAQNVASIESLESSVLEWLWDKIVEPVLDMLGFVGSPKSDWPRICWIPTGPLARLPLHAAGYHYSSDKNVLGRAISSYSLSLTALVQSYAHSQKQKAAPKPESAVLLGMNELHYAPIEVKQVAKVCQKMMRVHMPEPRTQDLLKALQDCDIFHFAGHGSSNPLDPSKSSLILSKGDRLSVSSLFNINLHKRKPFLAFLSACSTGQVKKEELLDEGLHIIAACQAAGFQHVIGTMWEVNDEACVTAARIIYEWMQEKGVSSKSVGEGLHHASRKLRDAWIEGEEMRAGRNAGADECRDGAQRTIVSDEEATLFWVPYVHYGI